jgi:DNA-binding response OmpR family regulator
MARILIIDDDADTRLLLEYHLKSAGHEPITAANGKEGLNRFLSDPVDLVITDLYMPEQDGLETITQLRRLSPALPIIAVTGRTPPLLAVARVLGSTEVLEKPFSADELLALVQKVCCQMLLPIQTKP